MTASPVRALTAEFFTALEAVVPPDDNSGLLYRRVESIGEEEGAGQHRRFVLLPPEETIFVRAMTATLSVLQYDFRVQMWLIQENRSITDFALDVIDEKRALMRFWVTFHEAGFATAGIEALKLIRPITYNAATRVLVLPFHVTAQETGS